jgi:hypothetical protein
MSQTRIEDVRGPGKEIHKTGNKLRREIGVE